MKPKLHIERYKDLIKGYLSGINEFEIVSNHTLLEYVNGNLPKTLRMNVRILGKILSKLIEYKVFRRNTGNGNGTQYIFVARSEEEVLSIQRARFLSN
jgi:hypothetical protein